MPSVTWKCPSNIALVKYWGKREPQLPENPSLSFTLDECHTVTRMHWEKTGPGAGPGFEILYDGKPVPAFREKTEKLLNRVAPMFPFLENYFLTIDTKNTFPHSSGIASSASGMGALALCLCSMEQDVAGTLSDSEFFKKASTAARLGSGSACRSVYGGLVLWGHSDVYPEGHDEYGVAIKGYHPVFDTYCDTILIVDSGEKEVSSTVGHGLLKGHPFAQQRFREAAGNIGLLKKALESGDLALFSQVTESEALMLHAMMMTSQPPFILMKPGTLSIIQKVRSMRTSLNLNMCITLDAGANVHLLYPAAERDATMAFIENELLGFCHSEQCIHDHVGKGPDQIKQFP